MHLLSNERGPRTPCALPDGALDDVRAGRPVMLVGEHDEPACLVLAARHLTPAAVQAMSHDAGGWVCLALTPERSDALGLRPLRLDPASRERTTPLESFEARDGERGAIGSAAQAHSIAAALTDGADRTTVLTPGHVPPLRAEPGGVLARGGPAEGAVDLMRIAGLPPAAAVAEVLDASGAPVPAAALPTRLPRVRTVPITAIAAHRLRTERSIERAVAVDLPTAHGRFTAIGYRGPSPHAAHHLALVKGQPAADREVLAHVQLQCLLGEALFSRACSCATRLHGALDAIERAGTGVVVYLARVHRDDHAGLCACEEQAPATSGARWSEDVMAAQILRDLGVARARLLPGYRSAQLERLGIPTAAADPP